MAQTPRVPENPSAAMTLDELIKALRDIKKNDPKAGARPAYAGSTNLIAVRKAAVSNGGTVDLTDA